MIGYGGYKGYGGYGYGSKSITGWEDSYYGGYMRLIRDYPYVRIPSSIDHKEGTVKSTLPYYESSKLRQMFLNLVNKHGLSDLLLDARNSKVITKTKYNYFTFKNETTEAIVVEAKPEDIEYVIAKISKAEPELAPLFKHFKESLMNSVFSVTIPPKDETPPNSGGGQEQGADGQGGEGQDGASEPDPKKSKAEAEPNYSVDESGNIDFKSEEQMNEFLSEIQKVLQSEVEKVVEGNLNKGGWNILSSSGGSPKFRTEELRASPYQLCEKISRNAQRLDRLLDITFDYDKDIVKSLRLGKLDLSKIAEVPAGNLSVYQREMEDQTTKPFSVCLLIDESGSMWGDNIRLARDICKMMHLCLSNVLEPDKLFIYGHSDMDIFTYQTPYVRDFERRIDNMTDRSSNYDTAIIEAVHEKVRSFTDDRIIMLVLSDGQPCNYDPTKHKQVCERAKRDDFIIGGIFVDYPGIEDMYNYNVTIHDLKKGPENVSQLLNKIVKTEFQ